MHCFRSLQPKKPFAVAVLLLAGAALLGAAQKNSGLAYNRDIRPVLAENCFSCHGTDSASRKAGLRLDHFETATNRLENGAVAILPAPLPKVRNAQWSRTPIDAFILARLAAEKLKPNPEADKRTLIRRVALDLTGLPPTPAEVEAFVNDPVPDAYEKVVDRLLASSAWGEHRAR